MKRKFLYGAFALVIATIVAVNIHINLSVDNDLLNLSFANIEQIAVAETNEPNSGWTWWTQGATKDEREYIRPCPTEQSSSGSGNASYGGASAGGSGSSSQTNPAGRTDISCPYGYDNCTPVGC